MRRRFSIWDEMKRMQKQMDSVFSNFFSTEPFIGSDFLLEDMSGNKDIVTSNYKAPASDLYETDKEVIAEIDMPGVDKKGLDINLEKGVLTINGDVHMESQGRQILREFSPANYYRQFRLTEHIDADKSHAELKNGVLTLKIPKAESAKPKKIEIKL